MKQEFSKYLKDKKAIKINKKLRISDEIEFWPEMIEPLYVFLLENDNYQEVLFGANVAFKGKTTDYLNCI